MCYGIRLNYTQPQICLDGGSDMLNWPKPTIKNYKFVFGSLSKDFFDYFDREIKVKGGEIVAEEWNRIKPSNEKEFLQFYREIGTMDELAYWHTKSKEHPKRIQSIKLIKILSSLSMVVKTILDLGSGIGTDSLIIGSMGFEITSIEPNAEQMKFLRYRAKKHNVSLTETIIGTEKDIKKEYDLILFLEVIEHIFDPFKFIDNIIRYKPKFLMFSQSFRQHKAPGGLPQHTDFNIQKIFQLLKNKGYNKIKIKGMAFPINVWTTTKIEIIDVAYSINAKEML